MAWGRSGKKAVAALVLASAMAAYGGAFKLYPGAQVSTPPVTPTVPANTKTKAEPAKGILYSTTADFARVAYFYRAIGSERKMPDGNGDGNARATFTFDTGETVLIRHAPSNGDPELDLTFIEVVKAKKLP